MSPFAETSHPDMATDIKDVDSWLLENWIFPDQKSKICFVEAGLSRSLAKPLPAKASRSLGLAAKIVPAGTFPNVSKGESPAVPSRTHQRAAELARLVYATPYPTSGAGDADLDCDIDRVGLSDMVAARASGEEDEDEDKDEDKDETDESVQKIKMLRIAMNIGS
ncbi:hypothetical protein K504DRAFT_538539 [Pleomassaria siparia CBS 279.74]|uniref:Uncharacterized protein n=1 Tax=Pleomassaria siparia CBS 279.74 TaxID=1314801 RepID=A0A6G1JTZ7_9PLEO|nr:hypothetical protein K504DRAFT_538539 [Pleomassaria siparia CBS 279.74]